MAKDIQVKINVSDIKNVEGLLAQAVGEIVVSRINDIPIEDRKYVLQKVMEDIKRWI